MRLTALLLSLLFLGGCYSGSDDTVAVSKGSAVCGSSSIIGKRLERVRTPGRPSCGFGDAVEVHSVAGVAVVGAPKMRCSTAKSLSAWTSKSAIPAVRRETGERLTSMTVWVGYACRSRTSGGRLSEHAKGNAVDIAAFSTDRGNTFTVRNDWRNAGYGRALRSMKNGACGPFGVVLHPDNDRAHHDHFHFDTSNRQGRYRYCRQRP